MKTKNVKTISLGFGISLKIKKAKNKVENNQRNESNIESERYRITTGELDFAKIIKQHIARAEKKKAQIQKYLNNTGNNNR